MGGLVDCCSPGKKEYHFDSSDVEEAETIYGLVFYKNKDIKLNSLHFHEKGSYMRNKAESSDKIYFEDVHFDHHTRKFVGTIHYEEQDMVCKYTLFFDEGFYKTVSPSKMVVKTGSGTELSTDVKDVLLYHRY